MATASAAMASVGQAANPAKMQQTMQQFAKENAKMDMASEMMGDAVDDALDDDEVEDETDDLMNQVMLSSVLIPSWLRCLIQKSSPSGYASTRCSHRMQQPTALKHYISHAQLFFNAALSMLHCDE